MKKIANSCKIDLSQQAFTPSVGQLEKYKTNRLHNKFRNMLLNSYVLQPITAWSERNEEFI